MSEKAAEEAAADTFEWATNKIREQAKQIGKQQDRIAELESCITNLIHCDQINTGAEPSLSCWHRAIDDAKEVIGMTPLPTPPSDKEGE